MTSKKEDIIVKLKLYLKMKTTFKYEVNLKRLIASQKMKISSEYEDNLKKWRLPQKNKEEDNLKKLRCHQEIQKPWKIDDDHKKIKTVPKNEGSLKNDRKSRAENVQRPVCCVNVQ